MFLLGMAIGMIVAIVLGGGIIAYIAWLNIKDEVSD